LREKEIDCPPECPFLDEHKSYQVKREMEKKDHSTSFPHSSPEEDILADERMAWLALHIEAPIKALAEREAAFSDREALHALEYARKKTERATRILTTIENRDAGAANELGELILQSMGRCKYEKKIILPDEHLAYSSQEKVKCLDRIILSLRYLSRDGLEKRGYIQTVLDRFSQIDEISHSQTFIPKR
jgi:hypothetical protein